jgi:ADP-heptose:LPS heptosyltransferase
LVERRFGTLQHYRAKGQSIVLLANAAWAEWAREMRLADEVWGLDAIRFERNVWYRLKWLRRIRSAGFAIVVHPTYSRAPLVGDSLVRASTAEQRIGADGDCTNSITPWLKRWSDHWYSRLIVTAAEPTMELIRHAQFLRGLGLSHVAEVPLLPTAQSRYPAGALPRPYAVLFVAASWEGRMWPTANFAEIGRRLSARGFNVVLAGGPNDRVRAMEVMHHLVARAIDLVGKTGLAELAELLRNAALVVTNETSAVHIGAAVRVPVLCIAGGGHYGRFVPYVIEGEASPKSLPEIVTQPMPCFGCKWKCVHPRKRGQAVKCIREIPTDEVWQRLERMLH